MFTSHTLWLDSNFYQKTLLAIFCNSNFSGDQCITNLVKVKLPKSVGANKANKLIDTDTFGVMTPLEIIFVAINLCDILRDSLRVFLVSLKGVLQKFEHHNRIFLLYALIQKFKKISHTYLTLNWVILNENYVFNNYLLDRSSWTFFAENIPSWTTALNV